MFISLIVTATVLALIERIPRIRLRPQRFFRNQFVSDLFYLLTGFVAGGSLALAYVTHTSKLVGDFFSIPRLATFSLPLWLVVILAVVALDLGNYFAHYCLHRFAALWE